MPVDKPHILQGEQTVIVDLSELNGKVDTLNSTVATINGTLSGVAAALDAILG